MTLTPLLILSCAGADEMAYESSISMFGNRVDSCTQGSLPAIELLTSVRDPLAC